MHYPWLGSETDEFTLDPKWMHQPPGHKEQAIAKADTAARIAAEEAVAAEGVAEAERIVMKEQAEKVARAAKEAEEAAAWPAAMVQGSSTCRLLEKHDQCSLEAKREVVEGVNWTR